jgi:tetratricopeptide (TPR) repeat protein
MLADEATRKALELDDSLPEAHAARADALTFSYKWGEAEKEFKRALELNPNSAAAHYFYAFTLLVPEKRFDEAIQEFRVALSLDPLSPIMNTNYAAMLMDAHRFPEAMAAFQKVLQSDPNFPPAHHKLSQLYAAQGDFANAVSELQKFVSKPGSWSPDAKGYQELAEAGFSGRTEASTWLALNASSIGDRNKAFQYLEKAYANQEIELILCIRYPTLDPIRSDPRYANLMRRMGLPE